MSDLVIFVAILALVAAVGIAVGIIVAGRIDRILSPGAAATPQPPTTPLTTVDATSHQAPEDQP
jgi:hypothetical protein